MMIVLVKNLHIACAILSGGGFILRGYWMLIQSPRLQHRTTRVLPHVVDTVLLASALALLILYQLNPLTQPWLMNKFLVLLFYIGFGTIALKRGKTYGHRVAALVAALCCFGFIISVAVTKSPWGVLG